MHTIYVKVGTHPITSMKSEVIPTLGSELYACMPGGDRLYRIIVDRIEVTDHGTVYFAYFA